MFAHHAIQHGVLRPSTAIGLGTLFLLLFTVIWLMFAFAMFSASQPVWEQLMRLPAAVPH